MRQYSAISGLWRAPLFSKAFYADVGINWRGIGFWYLTMLLVLSWGVVLTRHTLNMTNYMNTSAATDFKDMPPITIKGGEASSPVAQPHTMFSAGGKPMCVLDTTGGSNLPADVGAMMLITKTEMVQQDRSGRIERRPLSALPDGLYDESMVLGWIRMGRNMLLPVGLPVLTLLWLVFYLLMALIYALIGLALNAMFKGTVTFAGLMRIAVVGTTAAVILDTAVSLSGMPYQGLIWFLLRGLTLAYVVFGVWAAATTARPMQAFPVEAMAPLPVELLSGGTGAATAPEESLEQFP